MAWPSGTKASTANVDQGGDKISLARADIKQNIDNVNEIIDHINITSPSDGDVLRYSSSSGKWEQVASTSIITQFAVFQDNGSASAVSLGGYDYRSVTEIFDSGNFASITTDTNGIDQINLSDGTYMIEFSGEYTGTNAGSPVSRMRCNVILGDLDDSAGLGSGFGEDEDANGGIITLAGTNKIMLRFTTISGGAYSIDNTNYVKITKIS